MPFTIRVELHHANAAAYDALHKEMSAEGFSRQIIADNGKKYWLPPAEYNFMLEATSQQVLNWAQSAVQRTGYNASILVTKTTERAWLNLEDVKEKVF